MIYESGDLGITPKTSATVVAERVELMLDNNRFLDGPYIVSSSRQIYWDGISNTIDITGRRTSSGRHVQISDPQESNRNPIHCFAMAHCDHSPMVQPRGIQPRFQQFRCPGRRWVPTLPPNLFRRLRGISCKSFRSIQYLY